MLVSHSRSFIVLRGIVCSYGPKSRVSLSIRAARISSCNCHTCNQHDWASHVWKTRAEKNIFRVWKASGDKNMDQAHLYACFLLKIVLSTGLQSERPRDHRNAPPWKSILRDTPTFLRPLKFLVILWKKEKKKLIDLAADSLRRLQFIRSAVLGCVSAKLLSCGRNCTVVCKLGAFELALEAQCTLPRILHILIHKNNLKP